MKILLYDVTPAYLYPGGKQVHAQKIFENLNLLGVDTEYARWWEATQKCNLIHMFGCSPYMVEIAHQVGVKVTLTHLVDRDTNMPLIQRLFHKFSLFTIRNFTPQRFIRLFPWYIYPKIDKLIYLNKYDAKTAIDLYGISSKKTCVIPNGCDADDLLRLQDGPRNKKSYLISIASIIPRKNSVLLARAAKHAGVPVVFLGKPFIEEDIYYQEFLELVDNKYVIYPGYIPEDSDNKIRWLTEASGFVLLSKAESGCIAAYEGAAAGLPMLLSNLPWAHTYGNYEEIKYMNLRDETSIAKRLKLFFDTSERLNSFTCPVLSWNEIAKQYLHVFENILRS